MRHPVRRGLLAATAAAALVAGVSAAPTASAAPNNNSSKKLQKAVTLQGVLAHERALQRIADTNGGTRAAGTPGYDASAKYVYDKLAAAGYDVRYQPFEFPFFQENSPAELEQVSPTATTYVNGTEFTIMTYSGSGNVTATVKAVDIRIPPGDVPSGNTSGCEDSDFAGFVAGNIALIQRGTCTFGDKALNAQEAGASAVIIFNEGQPGRDGVLAGTLGAPLVTIPVVGTSFAVGADLADPAGTVARVATDTTSEIRTTNNVIAETKAGRDDNVVMAGAHLDSVLPGPGINDNGSGSSAILEVALQMAKVKPNNTVRFAWWSAEELGLLGSTYYVEQLSEDQRKSIALYLNFDMVGSPNFMRGIYDGDNSDNEGAGAGPAGSTEIEEVLESHFASRGLPFNGTDFSGRSDYGPFIEVGIPAGGLFTGAEGIKTEAQAAAYGGVAGAAYDPCYHQACDSLTPVEDGADAALYAQLRNRVGNLSRVALDTNADAIAHAVITFAFDTSVVNGETSPGKSHKAASKGSDRAVGRHGDVAR